jgi:hypothetical protein
MTAEDKAILQLREHRAGILDVNHSPEGAVPFRTGFLFFL